MQIILRGGGVAPHAIGRAVVFGLCFCLALTGIACARLRAAYAPDEKSAEEFEMEHGVLGCYVAEKLKPNYALKTTHLDVIYFANRGSEGTRYLRLSTPREAAIVRSLGELQNNVKITSAKEALEFVRLRTSSIFCIYSHQYDLEVSQAQIGRAGDQDDFKSHSGTSALLSVEAFRAGHFTAPVVRRYKAGYVIERWIGRFEDYRNVKVQIWRETVGSSGSYRLEVLRSAPAPVLPNTEWRIPPGG